MCITVWKGFIPIGGFVWCTEQSEVEQICIGLHKPLNHLFCCLPLPQHPEAKVDLFSDILNSKLSFIKYCVMVFRSPTLHQWNLMIIQNSHVVFPLQPHTKEEKYLFLQSCVYLQCVHTMWKTSIHNSKCIIHMQICTFIHTHMQLHAQNDSFVHSANYVEADRDYLLAVCHFRDLPAWTTKSQKSLWPKNWYKVHGSHIYLSITWGCLTHCDCIKVTGRLGTNHYLFSTSNEPKAILHSG